MPQIQYQPLAKDDDSSSLEKPSNHKEPEMIPGDALFLKTTRNRILVIGVAALILAIGFTIGTLSTSHGPFPNRSRSRWTNCGSTPEEALARSCQYDVMIGSWLLPDCSDQELMEEFIAIRDWEFFKDENLTDALPMDELRKGLHTYPVWATVHQHQHHCMYVWMKQFRAAARRGLMDDLSGNMDHTHHCANGLYTGMPGASKNLALAVKYFSCVEAGDGNPRRENNPNNELVKPT